MKLQFDFASVLLALGIALLPVYVFDSGGVQPAHAVLAVFFGLCWFRLGVSMTRWVILLAAMVGHSAFVEGIYTMRGADPMALINSVFFLYNFMFSVAVYEFVRRNGLGEIKVGLVFAAFLAVATVTISGVDLQQFAETGRSTGTFNNPNQLGYFSVCLLSLTYLLYRHGELSYKRAMLFFVASLFLAIASLSKAAMVANFAVIFLALKPSGSRYALALWAAFVPIALLVTVWLISTGALDDYLFIQRLANMAYEADSSLESRGYFAFLQSNGIQLLVGLGSEAVHDIVGHEVHSTLGSILNAYGLLGLAIFGGALWIWARDLWQSYGFIGLLCIAVPAMLYGITHNGTRFTIFWLLFAASLAMARHEIERRSEVFTGGMAQQFPRASH